MLKNSQNREPVTEANYLEAAAEILEKNRRLSFRQKLEGQGVVNTLEVSLRFNINPTDPAQAEMLEAAVVQVTHEKLDQEMAAAEDNLLVRLLNPILHRKIDHITKQK